MGGGGIERLVETTAEEGVQNRLTQGEAGIVETMPMSCRIVSATVRVVPKVDYFPGER